MSEYLELAALRCDMNIEVLDNNKLKWIYAGEAEIYGDLIIDSNPKLIQLNTNNELSTRKLKISNNNSLDTLELGKYPYFLHEPIQYPRFRNIEVVDCKNLIVFDTEVCESLEDFKIFKSKNLENLNLKSGLLSEIDISHLTGLIYFDISENPLTCIQVNSDQIQYVPETWLKDSEDVYSLNCGY